MELDRQNRDIEVIREVYSRWERGDFTSWEAFADDYVWKSADGFESGEYTGLAEISASWRTWLQAGMDSASRRTRWSLAPTAGMW